MMPDQLPIADDRPFEEHRGWDVAAHVSSLVLAVGVAAAVGTPYGWIAFLLPLGPLAVVVVALVSGRPAPRATRSLVAFTAVCAVLVGGGWLLVQAGGFWPPLSYVFPLGLLAFTLGLVNYVMVTVSRTFRAWRGQRFDYPWIPDRVAALVGLESNWEE